MAHRMGTAAATGDAPLVAYSSLPIAVREVAERELTEKQLMAFKLRYNGGSYVRISLIMGVSEATVRGHLRRAHQKLHAQLEEAA